MNKKSPIKKKKVGGIVRELGAIHEWMQDHEKHDDKRFEEGAATMAKLATKDDIQTVMVDQASKTDLDRLTRLLLDENGQPRFATKEDMMPVLNLYRGSTFVKSAAAGVATLIITIVAVGYALITLVQWIRGH